MNNVSLKVSFVIFNYNFVFYKTKVFAEDQNSKIFFIFNQKNLLISSFTPKNTKITYNT